MDVWIHNEMSNYNSERVFYGARRRRLANCGRKSGTKHCSGMESSWTIHVGEINRKKIKKRKQRWSKKKREFEKKWKNKKWFF